MASTINITKSSPGNIIITGKWTWYDYYKVEYSWENAPDGVTLPETINKIKNGSIIAVDTTYSSSSEVDTNDYYYTFSGWNKSGNITVNADTTITGIWTQNRYLTVSYSWTDAPTSVTLPNSTTRLKPGDNVTVDTTYNSSSEVDTDIKEKVVLSERSISNTNRKWTSVCYGNGKFIAVDNTNYFAYSNDGITWAESTISDTSRQWNSVCYGNGKFVAVGSGDDNQHTGGSTSNTKNFAYSTDGIKWTEGALGYDVEWSSVCYGNGKFVAVSSAFNYFAYSTDGINWTKGTISSTSRYWNSVCYGNNKYVAVGSHTEASGGIYSYFAYSTDGITWTEGTISSTSRYWNSVCYGNGMFVTVASRTNYFAYSTDGINWTEGTISSTSRNWRSVCYGNGMFVAIANNSYFAYSTDGINWTEGTISSTSRNWRSVCYGNDKFVAVAYNSNYFAYSTDSAYYYTFSGWDQTGNITVNADTTITGIWTLNKYLSVLYSWIDEPDGVTLPNTVTKLKPGDTVTVDTTYNSDSEVDTDTCYYTFSGWNQSGDIIVTSDTVISGVWTIHDYLKVSYSWTNAPSSVTLPKTVTKLKPGDNVTVDTTYNSSSEVDTNDYYYTFSGWNKSGNITVNADTTITGIWTQNKYLTVSYSWTDAPNGVTLPNSTTKLKPGDSVTVDTTYTSDSTVDINYTWTKGTISSTTSYRCVCYGNGKFVAGASMTKSNTSFAYSTDGINWTESTISDTNRDWRSICYGNGKFVAVGTKFTSSGSSTTSSGGYSAYSTDGITWALKTLNSSGNIPESVCYGNGKFVYVCNGYIGYSTDGISWTSTNTIRKWKSVCYGNDKFVAVANSTNYFAYSTDGITWTESTISDTSRSWYSVCYGNDKFVAVANKSYFAYSTDGITWTEGTISSTSRSWGCICYGNGKFVAVATNTIYFAYSTDGITWTESTISDTSRSWHSVCYGNPNNKDIYIAVDVNQTYYYSNLSGNEYYYSFSGWDKTGNITITDNTVISGIWTAHDYLSVSYSWTNAPNTLRAVVPKTITKLKPGDTVSIDTTYTNLTAKKDVDTTWTASTIDKNNTGYWQSVCYGNGMFVAVAGGEKTNYYGYSTDGINWTRNKIGNTTISRYSVCYGNGKFVTVAFSSNTFAYSTDGITWTEGTISSTNRDWYSVCYGNGKFVTVANGLNINASNYFAYSIDGITWTESTISDTKRKWNSVCYGNDKFVIVAYESYFAYSTDGITWTEGTISNTSISCRSVCYGNGMFVAVATKSYFAYSTDGITWTEGTISNTSRGWYSVCYGNGKFVAVATNSNYFAYSTDGITWTERSTISETARNWNSVCYGNGKFVAVAGNGNRIDYFSLTDIYYQFSGWDKTGNITINSDTTITGIWSKKDLDYSWNTITVSVDSNVPSNEVCYGNDKFVVVGGLRVGYSTNGIDWSINDMGLGSRNWISVCYGNDKFVAVSDSSANIAYSTDGINWTAGSTEGTFIQLYSVCYGNDKFVAVATHWSNKIVNGSYKSIRDQITSFSSSDGITWTENKISTNVDSNNNSRNTAGIHICYGNDKFVVIWWNTNSNSSLTVNGFAYSYDGITWTEGTISNTNRRWYSVCYGNGKFVAVAYNSKYFAYSTDGITWTESTISSTSRGWYSVCYGNGKFVAVASSSNYFAYSTDGINWTEGTISDTSSDWRSICYGNDKFVVVAYGTEFAYYSKQFPSNLNFID